MDTRLRKLDEGQYDAIVLAAAGLRRLGWEDRISRIVRPGRVMCPAVGQGALAIETRDDGGSRSGSLRKLDHAATRAAVTAERSLLALLGGGCQVPIGAHARLEGSVLHLQAIVASPDGARMIRDQTPGPIPHIGQRNSAERLLERRRARNSGDETVRMTTHESLSGRAPAPAIPA